MPKLRNPNDAPAREDGSSSDPNLHVVHGYTCKFCIERTGSSQTISRHIALNHEEERLRLGVQRKAMYEPVFLQAWTRSPPGGRYWIVAHGGSTVRPVGGKEAHDHLKGVFEREQGKQRLRKEMALADGAGINNSPQSTRFTDLKPWLERTGWEQTYQGVDRELLQNLTVVPSPATLRQGLVLTANRNVSSQLQPEEQMISSAHDERKIAALVAAVDAVMDRCEQTARTTSRSLLCWLRSVRPHTCYVKPFTFVGKSASRTKYIRLLKRFIAMIFRAYNLPVDIRRRHAGIRFKKAHVRLISAVWDHEIWKHSNTSAEGFWKSTNSPPTTDVEDELDEESDDEEEHYDDDTSSEYESSATVESGDSEDDYRHDVEREYGDDETLERDETEDYKGENWAMGESDGKTPSLIEEVLELLFGLIMELNTEEVMDGRPASTMLVYFSGILGFSADLNSFLPARSYTPNLAALIYIQRLLFIEYALPA
jgi:Fe-S-cluster containining protein